MSANVFLEIPSPEALKTRMRFAMVPGILVPILLHVGFVYMYSLNTDFEKQGFFVGEAFLSGTFGTACLAFAILVLIRFIYFVRGYDVPSHYTLDDMGVETKHPRAEFMIQENNWTAVFFYSCAVGLISLVVYLLQWIFGSLWSWSPIAILLPVCMAVPVVIALLMRKRNRRLNIERVKIMAELTGPARANRDYHGSY